MNRMKTLALVLLLALVGLSVLSRFTNSRQAAEPIAANHSSNSSGQTDNDNHEKVKDGEPIDFAVKQEIRKEFTLQPNVRVYVRGISGKLDVETSATDKAEVYLVRSVRNADDFEERKISIDLEFISNRRSRICIHIKIVRQFHFKSLIINR